MRIPRKAWVRVLASGVVLVSCALAVPGSGEGQPSRPEGGAPLRAPLERYSGTAALTGRDGRPQPLRVVVRTWIIDAHRTISPFPADGFLIVQLRAGQCATVIGGQRQERAEDEIWTVAAGSTMTIETGNDSATLHVVAVTGQ
jgi:hypothetical protein